MGTASILFIHLMQIQLTQVNDCGLDLRERRAAHIVQPTWSCDINCIFGGEKRKRECVAGT